MSSVSSEHTEPSHAAENGSPNVLSDVELPERLENVSPQAMKIESRYEHYFEHSGSEDEEQYDGSDTYDVDEGRPSRFRGPSSTWRSHTQKERALAASLDQQQANDLSIHLYNAHALKSRLRESTLDPRLKPWHSKQRWIPTNDEGRQRWYPGQSWTAWPLKPGDAPRLEERFGRELEDEEDRIAFWKQEPWKPSQDLEDELHAIMLRKAKEQWESRTCASSAECGVERRPQRHKIERSASRSVSRSSRRSAREDPTSGASDGHSRTDTDAAESAEPSDGEKEDELSRPTLMADDDEARCLLQPCARHILTKLDDLLLGLHKSRMNHYKCGSDEPRLRATKSTSRPRRTTRPVRSSKRPQTTDRQGRHSSREHGSSDETSEMSWETESGWITPSAVADERNVSRNRHHTRDWSEVLGMATMTGWDRSVVDTAARRCASLFGEGMAFRTLPEREAAAPLTPPLQYAPDMVPPLQDVSENESDDPDVGEEIMNKYVCPHRDCPRHLEPYDKGYRFREHLKRAHEYSREEIEELEQDLEQSRPTTLGERAAQDWMPPDPLVCPRGGCSRPDKVFPEVRRLTEHLRRAHGYDPRYDSPPLADNTEGEENMSNATASGEDSEIEMVGGVHNDGFLQVVPAIAGLRGADGAKRLVRSKEESVKTRGRSPWSRKLERREAKRLKVEEEMDIDPEA